MDTQNNYPKSGIEDIDSLTEIIHNSSDKTTIKIALELRDFRIMAMEKTCYFHKYYDYIYKKLDGDKLPTIFWSDKTFDLGNGYSLEIAKWFHIIIGKEMSFIYIRNKNGEIHFKTDTHYYSEQIFDQYYNLIPSNGGKMMPDYKIMSTLVYYLREMSDEIRCYSSEKIFNWIIQGINKKGSNNWEKSEAWSIIKGHWNEKLANNIYPK